MQLDGFAEIGRPPDPKMCARGGLGRSPRVDAKCPSSILNAKKMAQCDIVLYRRRSTPKFESARYRAVTSLFLGLDKSVKSKGHASQESADLTKIGALEIPMP
jgi:hypothetical protein